LHYDEVLIKVKTNDNPILNSIPFEILNNGEYFIFSTNRVLIRYVFNNDYLNPKTGDLKRFLFILAEPSDMYLWGHDKVVNEINDKCSAWDKQIIRHAAPNDVLSVLNSAAISKEPYDAIFVIAHGAPPSGNMDGYLLLEEKGTGKSIEFTSSSFSAGLCGHQGCFVFLCSCSSGRVIITNPMASIGHQLIYNGPAGAVLAMQKPIGVSAGLDLFISFINSLNTRRNIYQGYRNSMAAYLGTPTHGIPSLTSRQMKSETNEVNQICSVLSLDKGRSRVAFIFPGFKMGMKPKDYQSIPREEWARIINGRYKYSGLTLSQCDINASKGIMMLLGKVFDLNDLDTRVIVDSDENSLGLLSDTSITHFILFGSRSHSYSRKILKQYSKDFIFDYSAETWILTDKRTKTKYKVQNPSKGSEILNTTDTLHDYAIVEKAIDEINNRVIIVIAGMWDLSTLAAGRYLSSHIDELDKKFANGGFQLLLEIQTGTSSIERVIAERRPNRKP